MTAADVARDPIVDELPRELYVEVTNRCNSLCQACVRTFRKLEPLRDLRLDEFQALVDQFPVLERVVLHGIGEPLLNAELPAMIRTVKDAPSRRPRCCLTRTPSCSTRPGSRR